MEKEKDVSRGRKQNESGTRQQGAERRKAENTTDKNKRTSKNLWQPTMTSQECLQLN